MKAILVYSLPDEADDYMIAARAFDIACAIDAMFAWLRTRIKYDDNSDEVDDALEEVRGKFWEIAEQHDIVGVLS